jgi:hypothetical protein
VAILEKLEKYIIMEDAATNMSVSIKDLDENAYRNLKAEAVRSGMKVSDAATEAFRLWVASKRQTRQRDRERMREAAADMDRLRGEGGAAWSGAEEIRRWRDERKR